MPSTPSRSSTLTESSAELLHKALGSEIDLQSQSVYLNFKNAIESKPVQDETLLAIKELKGTVRYVGRAFQRIGTDLQRFDAEGYRDRHGVLLHLSPEWSQLHENFHDILDTSRENATDAAAFMKQFTVAVLQDVEEPDYPALKEELETFRQLLADKEKNARKAKKEFNQLAEDVRLFGTNIPLVLEEADVSLTAQIANTQHRIADLHDRLQQISHETTQMAEVCIASFAMAAVGVGLAIVTLSPDAFALAITSVAALGASSCGLAKLLREKKKVKQELKECDKQMTLLMAQQEALARHKASLEGVQSDIKELTAKIDTFVNIWQSLGTDLHSFSEQLQYAVGPTAKINKKFPAKIASTRVLYQTLVVLLEEYAKASITSEDEETLCDADDDYEKGDK